MERAEVEVAHDADDLRSLHLVAPVELVGEPLPDGLGRTRPAKGPHERFVHDDGVRRVRREGRIEVAPGDEVHLHRLDEVRLDAVDHDVELLALVLEAVAGGAAPERDGGAREVGDRRVTRERRAEPVERLAVARLAERDHGDLVAVVAEVAVLDVAELRAEDERPREQEDRERELHHHERPREGVRPAEPDARLQRLDRAEPREQHRRVAPRHQPRQHDEPEEHGEGDGQRDEPERERLARQRVERRQEEGGEGQPEGEAERAHQEGLAPELPEELAAVRAHRLPDADLLRPRRRAADGERHKVDARDQQHGQRDRTEDLRVERVARRREAGVDVRVEVEGGEGLEEVRDRCAVARPVALVAHTLDVLAVVRLNERRHLRLDGGEVGAFAELHVGEDAGHVEGVLA